MLPRVVERCGLKIGATGFCWWNTPFQRIRWRTSFIFLLAREGFPVGRESGGPDGVELNFWAGAERLPVLLLFGINIKHTKSPCSQRRPRNCRIELILQIFRDCGSDGGHHPQGSRRDNQKQRVASSIRQIEMRKQTEEYDYAPKGHGGASNGRGFSCQ